MQASIKTEPDGTVNLQLDAEAARAVFACVVFASRFHEGLTPLAVMAADGLYGDRVLSAQVGRRELCQ